jgi:hypothetical protein
MLSNDNSIVVATTLLLLEIEVSIFAEMGSKYLI